MERIKILLNLAISLSLLSLINCPRSTINYVMIYRNTNKAQWQIDNVLLAKDIQIKDVKEVIKNNILYVNILLKNGWYRPISGKIKVEFYDENGIQLENPWGWHPLLLESHQEEWFKFIAPQTAKSITKIKVMIQGIKQYSMPER